ncbi:hypothetical protein L6270_02830 [Candidatus Parcubacteria bacterium]|nr:hypothetical protein [Patescibacteria group bacterium]MBU4308895.1 hypothetical protein [Patescibacteria group bacterium]MBU4432603.1 hypothetical protein [Patescibacteria group bacterium]MBU4577255.1 hypothetical protein [Patescibacteria group bacterium]MCG2696946.1 hypothetical protein [Candidatus Parcubacteria bacterium]
MLKKLESINVPIIGLCVTFAGMGILLYVLTNYFAQNIEQTSKAPCIPFIFMGSIILGMVIIGKILSDAYSFANRDKRELKNRRRQQRQE